jgi:hypothetical protein
MPMLPGREARGLFCGLSSGEFRLDDQDRRSQTDQWVGINHDFGPARRRGTLLDVRHMAALARSARKSDQPRIHGTRSMNRLSEPRLTTKARMGGTGLEPVTPSLSNLGRHSRRFAPVLLSRMVEPSPGPSERSSERERTRILAILATLARGVPHLKRRDASAPGRVQFSSSTRFHAPRRSLLGPRASAERRARSSSRVRGSARPKRRPRARWFSFPLRSPVASTSTSSEPSRYSMRAANTTKRCERQRARGSPLSRADARS